MSVKRGPAGTGWAVTSSRVRAVVNDQYSTAGRPAAIYVGSRVVGHVEGGIFFKAVKGSVHFLRQPRAIAFDISTLRDAERAGASRVRVTDIENGRVYDAAITTIWERGFRVNRGHGAQWALILAEFGRPGEVPAAAQLSLF